MAPCHCEKRSGEAISLFDLRYSSLRPYDTVARLSASPHVIIWRLPKFFSFSETLLQPGATGNVGEGIDLISEYDNVFSGKVRKTGYFQKAGFPGNSERILGIYSGCQKFCPIAQRIFSRSGQEYDLPWAWLGHRTCPTGRMSHWLNWRLP